MNQTERDALSAELRSFVERNHSLTNLFDKIVAEIDRDRGRM
jgi:hypothetical protein